MQAKPFKTVCIVGAGYMGAQIGLRCATHGYTVWLVDALGEALQRTAESHTHELEKRVEEQEIAPQDKEVILRRIHLTVNMEEGASKADLVIEAVPERLEIKREVFAQLDEVCPRHTILATNSSSLRISAIENATHRLDKVLNMHFYSLAMDRTMVELMRGTATSDDATGSGIRG